MNFLLSKLKIIITGIIFTFSVNLLAQSRLNPQDTIPVEEVVITPNRFGSVQKNTPEAIKTIRSNKIMQSQMRTAPEALQLTPGVFVQKTNHGGGSPFLRGLTGNQILMLIDGIRLSNSTMRYGPNQYFNTIDVFSLERIEVLRGSGSVQYGSDALGGTIQVFTPELQYSENRRLRSNVYSRIATHDMEKSLHTNLVYSSSKASFRGGVTFRDFGDITGGDTTGKQNPTGYREIDFDLKGKVRLSSSTDLTMAYQSVTQNDVPVYHKVLLENYAVNKMDPQKRELAYAMINSKLERGILKSLRITAAMQSSAESRISRKNDSGMLRTEKDRVRSLSLTSELLTTNDEYWSATSGFEIYKDLVKSNRIDRDLNNGTSVMKRGLYPDGAAMTSIAAFTLHTIDLPGWNFTAGARFNSYIISVEDESVGKTKLTPSTLVGNIGIFRKLNNSSGLFLSVDQGFRAPNIDDLGTLGIVDFRYEVPNFNLDPEHSLHYQAGYKFQNRRIKGDLYFYRNDLYNLIVRNRFENQFIEGYPVYLKENTERAYIQGVETSWEYSPVNSWLFSGSLTYAYGQNKTLDEPVRRIPPLFGSLNVEYRYNEWFAGLEWISAGKQDRLAKGDIADNRIPAGGTPGWNVFNINAGLSVKFVRFGLSIKNMLNNDYRYHGSGINGYGRSAFLSAAFRF